MELFSADLLAILNREASKYAYLAYQTLFSSEHVSLPQCRILPGDEAWPATSVWDSFNASIDGRLIKTIPIGHVCHHPTYDEAKCEELRKTWRRPHVHADYASSVMDSFFLNQSCDPWTPAEQPCTLGNYVQYAVNVSEPHHVQKTLAFAKAHNIRFVIKNTGHDYMGKSTGAGGLSVWMHHLQDVAYIPEFNVSTYTGPAIKAAAGVTGHDASAFASTKGHTVVSGECVTVGMVGGYLQGGGHSALSSLYGMGADSVLSYEVITPEGNFVTASPDQNQDLYWALSGGGPGTYGVVWSATVKAHPDFPVTVALAMFTAEGLTQDAYWEGVAAFQALAPQINAAKAFAFSVFGSAFFSLTPLFAPNSTTEEITELLKPFVTKLNSLGIKHTLHVATHPNYVTAFNSVPAFQYENQDISNFQLGNRIIPRSVWEKKSTFDGFIKLLRNVGDNGGLVLDVTAAPTHEAAGYPNNAVLPAWRKAYHAMTFSLALNDITTQEALLKDQDTVLAFTAAVEEFTPGSGAYLNEASPADPEWKTNFYGSNYDRLLEIKNKYDPHQLLYGSTAVGGDRWRQDASGRLCRP